jgi:hypothetical protein
MAGDLFGWPAVVGQRNLHGPLAVAVPAWPTVCASLTSGSAPLRCAT